MEHGIGIVGLGHVGLPLLAALANVGCTVVGLDIDRRKVEFLRRTLKADIYEPGVNDVLQRYAHNISFTTSYAELMGRCDTLIVTVGTPLTADNAPDVGVVDQVGAAIGELLRRGQLLIFQSALHEFHAIPKIVGGINRESTERAARVVARLGGKVVHVSSPEVAEVAKLVDN